MKRTVIASLLGSAAIVSSAHAQGNVVFSNYQGTAYTYAPIFYGAGFGAKTGTGLDSSFNVVLYYYLGTASEGSSDAMPGGGSPGWELAACGDCREPGPAVTSFGPLYLVGSNVPIWGFFEGGQADIWDYIGGPITFEVAVFNGSSYATSTLRAHSAAFTLPIINVGLGPATELGPGLLSFSVNNVPHDGGPRKVTPWQDPFSAPHPR